MDTTYLSQQYLLLSGLGQADWWAMCRSPAYTGSMHDVLLVNISMHRAAGQVGRPGLGRTSMQPSIRIFYAELGGGPDAKTSAEYCRCWLQVPQDGAVTGSSRSSVLVQRLGDTAGIELHSRVS